MSDFTVSTDVEIVRQILELELKKTNKVHKLFVIELIKDNFSHIRIVNKVFSENRATENGPKNFNAGAKKIFRDSFRGLKKYFSQDEKGWITSKNNDVIEKVVKKTDEEGLLLKKKTKRGKLRGKLYEYNGQVKTISEWASILQIKVTTLGMRLSKYNWSIDKAFSTPVKKYLNSEKLNG